MGVGGEKVPLPVCDTAYWTNGQLRQIYQQRRNRISVERVETFPLSQTTPFQSGVFGRRSDVSFISGIRRHWMQQQLCSQRKLSIVRRKLSTWSNKPQNCSVDSSSLSATVRLATGARLGRSILHRRRRHHNLRCERNNSERRRVPTTQRWFPRHQRLVYAHWRSDGNLHGELGRRQWKQCVIG